MADTNFDLAPPSKIVDGLKAVPVDIQKITATLTFDGANSTGTGDATLEFTTGAVNGNPIFDLRQNITHAWLDDVAILPAKLKHHDFGGGDDAELRIVESVLAANTTHKLRVKYTLGPPQASTAGQYKPAMTWSNGPRLVFNFGFTDLGAGRYLESWVPANLIYDQFELVLTLRILNTAIAHTVITNGTATSLGTNHWSIAFPKRFTALSTLLELRATDTLTSQTGTKLLPVSNTNVTIEAWRLNSTQVNLTTEINNIKNFLGNNETAIGPYVHGDRFVAFFHSAAMEYEGGTTSGPNPLRHETFHSWWARGLKPASQADAWWDEAWTVYNMSGAAGSLPFDFSEPAVKLCSRNPWVRATAGGAYTDGERFFQGVAALIGVAKLNSLMSKFYKERKARPATTTDIEEFLVCQTGNPALVDAFHRFVYGFADPSPAPDLWLHDDPAHAGPDTWAGAFWNSPDLWIRNADDGGTTHQNPEFGQDNWFYARVHNRSTATASHFLVTFNVKPFAGVEFQYPADFLPCIAAASGFDLQPNSSAIVKARWPKALVPQPGTHPCWLASVLTRFDRPVAGRHVWEHNNLAQKNLTVVNLKPNDWIILPFVVNNLKPRARSVTLELFRPHTNTAIAAALVHKTGTAFKAIGDANLARLPEPTDNSAADDAKAVLDCGGRVETQTVDASDDNTLLTSRTGGGLVAAHFTGGVETAFASGRATALPISLRPTQQLMMGLRVTAPPTAKAGDVFRLDLVQKGENSKSIVGGIAVEIRIS